MKKMVLALCALSLSLLGGCGVQVDIAQSIRDGAQISAVKSKRTGPPIQLYPTENCSGVEIKAYSPSNSDQQKFVSRLDPEKKSIEIAINLSCVQKLYSARDIDKWKDKGDPVAILAYLDKNYRNYKKLCKDYDYVKSLLIIAQKEKIKISDNDEYIIRTPEAYIIEVIIDNECLGIDMNGFFIRS